MSMNKNGKRFFTVFFILLIGYIIYYPKDSYVAAYDGLYLWLNVVFPSLLPFFICVEILVNLGFMNKLGSTFGFLMKPAFRLPGEAAFGFFMSIASGYPVGARITALLYSKNICSKAECQRMLSLCSTSGPLFIIGAVASGMLNSPKIGVVLASAHFLSAIVIGLIIRFYGHGSVKADSYSHNYSPIPFHNELPIGAIINDSIKNSILLMLNIGGYIILFSVIACVLKISGILAVFTTIVTAVMGLLGFVIEPAAVSGFLIGIVEMTNGINQVAASTDTSLIAKLIIISFLIGFGGISVNLQVLSVISETNLNFKLYLMLKVLQGAAAALLTYFFYSAAAIAQVFNINKNPILSIQNNIGWFDYLTSSLIFTAILLLTLRLLVIARTSFVAFAARKKF